MPTRRAKKYRRKTLSLEPKFLLSSILGNVYERFPGKSLSIIIIITTIIIIILLLLLGGGGLILVNKFAVMFEVEI